MAFLGHALLSAHHTLLEAHLPVAQELTPAARGQRRSNRNTIGIQQTTIRLLADEGWGALNAAAVARAAGLSTFAVRSRATSNVSLAALVWEEVGAALSSQLTAVADGLGALRSTGDDRLLTTAWLDFARQSVVQDAAMELLTVANTITGVAAVVDPGLSLGRLLTDVRTAYAISVALGLAMTNRFPWAYDQRLPGALHIRARALAADEAAQPLPSAPAVHMSRAPILVPEDPALDRLLNAALATVAEKGFDALTVRGLGAAAEVSQGYIFHRYPTKRELFLDAVHRQQQVGYANNDAYLRGVASTHGLAIAEACYLREALSPAARLGRAMVIEQHRMAWHDSALLRESIDRLRELRWRLQRRPGWGQIETEADFYLNVAAPLGALLLPRFAPDVGGLPWDVVLSPLVTRMQHQHPT